MARFFKAPVVQPIDYGFKMPFGEIMGALQAKQKDQDTKYNAATALYAKNLDTLSPDYAKRQAHITAKNKRVDQLLFDPEGNLQDLTSKGPQIQAEARRQLQEDVAGGIEWALKNTKTKHDDYNALVDKQLGKDKLIPIQATYLKEKSFYDYAQKGGLGDGQGYQGAYAENQLFKGIDPATAVNIPKLGEKLGDKVGRLQIQTSGFEIGEDGKVKIGPDFTGKDDNRFRQTGTLMTKTYDRIYNSVSEGLQGDAQALSYLRQEAEAILWAEGNRNPKPEQVNAIMQQRIDNEANRAGNKFMETMFNPKVLQDWKAKERAKHNYRVAEIKLQERNQRRVVETPIDTLQNTVDATKLHEDKAAYTEKLASVNERMKLLTNEDGTVKPGAEDEYLQLKRENKKLNIQITGVTNSENYILSEVGLNDSKLMLSTLSEQMDYWDPSGKLSNGLYSYILFGDEGGINNMKSNTLMKLKNFKDKLDLYADDPKTTATFYTEEMNQRARQVASGSFPPFLKKEMSTVPLAHQQQATIGGIDGVIYTISSAYAKSRSKSLEEAASTINAKGGLNFQSNLTNMKSLDTSSQSVLSALEKGMTESFIANDFAGLLIAQGGLAGKEFSPDNFMLNEGDQVDHTKIQFNLIKENNAIPGMGGGRMYQASAPVVVKDANGNNKTIIRQLPVLVDPTRHENISDLTVEHAMEQLSGVPNDLSDDKSKADWSAATELIGGVTPLMQNIYDQGLGAVKPGTQKVVYDDEGRSSVGVWRNRSGNYMFYHSKLDSDGKHYIDFNDHSTRIKDTRANFDAASKKAQGISLDTEFKYLSDFQQLVGEKAYKGKINKKGINTLRQLYQIK